MPFQPIWLSGREVEALVAKPPSLGRQRGRRGSASRSFPRLLFSVESRAFLANSICSRSVKRALGSSKNVDLLKFRAVNWEFWAASGPNCVVQAFAVSSTYLSTRLLRSLWISRGPVKTSWRPVFPRHGWCRRRLPRLARPGQDLLTSLSCRRAQCATAAAAGDAAQGARAALVRLATDSQHQRL